MIYQLGSRMNEPYNKLHSNCINFTHQNLENFQCSSSPENKRTRFIINCAFLQGPAELCVNLITCKSVLGVIHNCQHHLNGSNRTLRWADDQCSLIDIWVNVHLLLE